MSDIERERRAVADEIEEMLTELKGGNVDRSLVVKALGLVILARKGTILAALRQPTPSADPGTAGRDAGAAEMRERAARVAERPNAGLVPPDGGDPTPAEMLWNVAADIRSLPLRPEGETKTTEGGEHG